MELKAYIEQHFDEEVKALQGLLRIKSVECLGEDGTVFGRGAQDCLDYCLRMGETMGFTARDVDGYCGYLEHGDGEELVIVLGHLDVVPEGTGWSHPPYAAEIADGKLYARGAIDDKGPMMAALHALHAIKACGIPLKRRVRILFGLNEETGCACIEHYVEKGEELPVLGFTPDGNFPIINGEKGICAAMFSYPLHGAGAYALRSFSGGTALNMVPAMAQAELNWPADERDALIASAPAGITVEAIDNGVRITAQGRSAHGSTPEKGDNAIVKLAAFLATLPDGQFAASIAKRYPQNTIGEALGIALHDDVSGSMVVNLGTAATENGVVTLGVNLRCPVTFGEADFRPALTQAMEEAGFAMESFSFTNPLYMPPESELIRKLQAVYEQETGEEAVLEVIGGGTYAKEMPNTVAFGPIFPGEACVEHEPDEYISLDSLKKMTEIYAAAIVALANE